MDGHYAGLMSGTSMDAIDACIVEIDAGRPQALIARHALPIPQSTKTALHRLVEPNWRGDLDTIAALDHTLGLLQVEALQGVVKASGLGMQDLVAVGCHGQTIAHRPNGPAPYSWQIGNPQLLATQTGVTTVADLRRGDIACGGQGAPLVPPFHRLIAPPSASEQVFLNIGGIANITVLLGDDGLFGYDTGPGNALMDAWSRQHRNRPFDRQGAWAASGQVNEPLLKTWLADPYFRQPPPKSTGREYFNLAWIEHQLPMDISAEDVQATLCELTARSIGAAICSHTSDLAQVWVCGGGWHNQNLIARLTERLRPRAITHTGSLGFPPDWVEAAAFAWLAYCAMSGIAANETRVTGATRKAILGAIYPGRIWPRPDDLSSSG